VKNSDDEEGDDETDDEGTDPLDIVTKGRFVLKDESGRERAILGGSGASAGGNPGLTLYDEAGHVYSIGPKVDPKGAALEITIRNRDGKIIGGIGIPPDGRVYALRSE